MGHIRQRGLTAWASRGNPDDAAMSKVDDESHGYIRIMSILIKTLFVTHGFRDSWLHRMHRVYANGLHFVTSSCVSPKPGPAV